MLFYQVWHFLGMPVSHTVLNKTALNNHSAISQYCKQEMIQQTPLYACIVAEIRASSGSAISWSV